MNRLEHIHVYIPVHILLAYSLSMSACVRRNRLEQAEPEEIIKYVHNSINHKCPLDDDVGGMP